VAREQTSSRQEKPTDVDKYDGSLNAIKFIKKKLNGPIEIMGL